MKINFLSTLVSPSVLGSNFDVKGNPKMKKQMKMETLCEKWLIYKKPKVKETTISAYYRIINAHIIPHFNYDLVSFIEKKKAILAPKTVHEIFGVLKQILEYGFKKKYIKFIDCDILLPSKSRKEIKILSNADYERFIDNVLINLNLESLGFLVALFTGVRIGELCALKWQDIDFKTKEIKITKTIQRVANLDKNAKTKTKIIIDTPKSKNSIRDIDILPFLLKFLKRFKGNGTDYILTGNSKYIEPRTYQNKFKKFIENIGIEDISPHSLRHTFATLAVENEMDIKVLSKILGHSSVYITYDLYVHPSKELRKQNMNKMADTYPWHKKTRLLTA